MANEAKPYGPDKPFWSFSSDDPFAFYSPFLSGAQRLENGNTFITEGVSGRFFEIDRDGKLLWDYMTPYAGYVINPDGTTPQPTGHFIYATFRSTHIASEHPALSGKTLTPLRPQPPVYTPPIK